MKKYLYWLFPVISFGLFIIWTVLVKTVDVQYINDIGYLGFYNFNTSFNEFVQSLNFTLFDKLSNVFLIISLCTLVLYCILALIQLIKNRSFKKVNLIFYILLGTYVIIAISYFVFELYKVNYSPLSVKGDLKASYPSSHVFVTCACYVSALFTSFELFNMKRILKCILIAIVVILCGGEIIARLFCGFHYFTDIIGGMLLSITISSLFVATLKAFKEKGLIKKYE